MDERLPAWLVAARDQDAGVSRPAPRSRLRPPVVGQIRVVQHMDLRLSQDRLALIVGIEDDLAVAHVLLVSPLVEYAAALDYRFEPLAAGGLLPLIAECDVRGAVWYAQLGEVIGRCSAGLARKLDRAGRGELPTSLGLDQSRFGLPARDERDPRWTWKLTELDSLLQLTGECDESLLSGHLCPGIVDPALLDHLIDVGKQTMEPTPEVTQQLFSHADKHEALVSGDSLESLEALLEAADPDTRAALSPLVERSLAALTSERHTTGTWVGPRKRDIREKTRLAKAVAERVPHEDRCVVVLTTEAAWVGREKKRFRPAVVEVDSERRVQVRPVDVHVMKGEVPA